MIIPEGILCAKSHEWAIEDTQQNITTIGLTDLIINKLGEIVSVELPEIGTEYSKNEAFATIESIKSASEAYMPVSGKIIEINESLINSPELINEDPFEAWLIKIKASNFQEDSQDLIEYNDYIDEI